MSEGTFLFAVSLDFHYETQDGENDCGRRDSGVGSTVAEVGRAVTTFTFDSTDVVIQAVVSLSGHASRDTLSQH